jgi:hypothetical protein
MGKKFRRFLLLGTAGGASFPKGLVSEIGRPAAMIFFPRTD